MQRLRRMGIVATILLAACGREGVTGSALPVQIEDFHATSLTELDAGELAAEALDVEAAAALLESTGFGSAVERSYAGPGPGFRRIEVRIVRFDTSEGAERFLTWQLAHASDVIGDTEPSTAQPIPGVRLYIHVPDGCCPREQVLVLAAWRRGRDVVRVLVAGPEAEGSRTATLIGDLRLGIPADA